MQNFILSAMILPMSLTTTARREFWLLAAVFCAAACFHLYSVTVNWTMPFMSGHEFRQAQTALVTHYIDQQNNFSLIYETPILGKPWVSILLEVPFYEWGVVGLSRLTGWEHVVAARTISLLSFYLALPAFYLLLGRLALPPARRLLVLSLVLVCPVYIYYSRAFLIDATELMCCAWFLLGFVRTMDQRHWGWLALTIVAGTGAALIKSATLAVWLVPGAAYGAWLLWRDLRARTGWRAPLTTLAWGLATVVVALGLLRWWLVYTDAIKAQHPSAWIFTSYNLSQGNWGLFNFASLTSADTWRYLFYCWGQAVMPPWLIGAILIPGLIFLPTVRKPVLGLAGAFLFAQIMFPFAYAYQDYYFYANAVFLIGAFGFLLIGLLDSKLPRPVCWLLMAVPFAGQVATYWTGYRPGQLVVSEGRSTFTEALREFTPPNSVLVIAGADWAAMTPLYSERKALMIRNGLEYDHDYLNRAFADLADEDVAALVVVDKVRTNRPFLEFVARKMDIDISEPIFSHPMGDVYLRRLYSKGALIRLRDSTKYPDLKYSIGALDRAPSGPFAIDPATARTAFPMITPGPYQAQFTFGLDVAEYDGRKVISTHPDSDVWLRPPPAATTINWRFGIMPMAYEKSGDRSDGVEFVVTGTTPDGGSREVFRRLLDPVRQPADRGDQQVEIAYTPREGEVLHFATRPNGHSAYDWCYWVKLEVK